jgi:hypothetical protein
MSDLGLGRYLGYADLPEAEPLKKRLDAEMAAHRENGIHLIVTQSADGSLVVGDSHHYAATPDLFRVRRGRPAHPRRVRHGARSARSDVTERWIGTYASAAGSLALYRQAFRRVRIVVVTSGCGASTAFGIGEETIDELYGRQG